MLLSVSKFWIQYLSIKVLTCTHFPSNIHVETTFRACILFWKQIFFGEFSLHLFRLPFIIICVKRIEFLSSKFSFYCFKRIFLIRPIYVRVKDMKKMDLVVWWANFVWFWNVCEVKTDGTFLWKSNQKLLHNGDVIKL